jgi:hypothetical protein
MNNQVPEIVRQTLLAKRSLLLEERAKLDAEIFQIENFLGLAKADSLIESETSISRKILDFASANILPGVNMTTDKIYHLMVVNGVKFPPGKPPKARITRVLSGTKLYKGHKTLGWSLKGKGPVAAGS